MDGVEGNSGMLPVVESDAVVSGLLELLDSV